MKKKILRMIVGFGIVLLASTIIRSGSVSAAMVNNTIKSKAIFEGVYQCLKGGAYQAQWSASNGGKAFLLNRLSEETVKLPFGWTDASDNNTNCYQVMEGFSSNSRDDDKLNQGLIPSRIRNTGNVGEIVNYFAGANKDGVTNGLGWKAESQGNVRAGQETEQVKYLIDTNRTDCRDDNGDVARARIKCIGCNGNEAESAELVFPKVTKNQDGNWFFGNTSSSLRGVNVPAPGSGSTYTYEVCGAHFAIRDEGSNSSVYYVMTDGQSDSYVTASGGSYKQASTWKFEHRYTVPYNSATGEGGYEASYPVWLKSEIIKGKISSTTEGDFDDYKMVWQNNLMDLVSGLNKKNENGYSVPGLAKTYSGLRLSEQEVYELYKYYINDVYKVPIICEGEEGYDLYGGSPKINWQKGKACRADVDHRQVVQSPGNVYGVEYGNPNSSSFFHFTKVVSLNDVIATLNMLDLNKIDGAEEGGTIADSSQLSETTVEPSCANSGAAESLGWIICPILKLLSNTSEWLYSDYVEPALRVQPTLFSKQGDTYGTGFAWRIFQGFANTVFIILLIVVIFSQLTGIGIDNYGIKKILPKLIIAAILINLSYLICLILVDLSNILGNGLQTLFAELPTGGNELQKIIVGRESIPLSNSGNGIVAAGTTTLTGVVLFGILAAGIWGAVSSGGLAGIILPLLMAALTIVISIFFLFLLLSARQAAIIALTVISPLAFACYILPNTKKLFDKWVKLGQGLLLVYPIVGLLVGGGNYVSRLLLSSGVGENSFAMAFMAMIVGVVPIFFIPSVLKGSFVTMGNLGAKISGFGDRMRRGTSKRVQESAAYKAAQERGREQGTRFRAGIGRDGNARNVSRFGRLIRGGQRGMARARGQYLKDQDARIREGSLMGIGYAAAQKAQEKRAGADEIANEMILIKSDTNDGANETKLQEIFDEAMENKQWNKARAAMRLAGRRKDTAAKFTEGTLLNSKKSYSPEALSKVAKEISEGETAGNYRAGSPFAFEYASQWNKGATNTISYADWLSNKENIHDALTHHVTTGGELMGVQGKNLKAMADLIKDGNMNDYDVGYLRNLAQEAIRTNQQNGTAFDANKAEQIYRLAYGDNAYQARMNADGVGNLIEKRNGNVSSGGTKIQVTSEGDWQSFMSERHK